jgi:hypothetical protein
MTIPSHHNLGDAGHKDDHNAIVDVLTTHDQAIGTLQTATVGIFYLAGGNVTNINDTTTIWSRINLPAGDRSTAPDTIQFFHGANKIFWLDGWGQPRVKNDDPARIPWVVDSVTGQTASLNEWRVNGVTKARIDSAGNIVAPNTTPGAWTNITLQSGLVGYGSPASTPQYRIINDVVELRGLVAKSNGSDFTSSPVTIGTLPSGARPARLNPPIVYCIVPHYVSGSSFTARLQVDSAGVISIYFVTGDSPTWLGLDGARYSILP